jgi:uracil-DNA glycosylase
MQLTRLHKKFDDLQTKFGEKELSAIYGAGEIHSPEVCFVFMNPTARNISAVKEWKGIRAPWLGTKNTWKLITTVGLLDKELNKQIQSKKHDWDREFAEKVYQDVKRNKCFITNLAKCTQKDAAHLPNSIFEEYRNLMFEEIKLLNPKIIITFGNQVSSILLNKTINVSRCRKQAENLVIEGKTYKTFPIFYPVGQGMRNMSKAIEDISWVLKKNGSYI